MEHTPIPASALMDDKILFVSDEGDAFKETTGYFSWEHVYDRKHFTTHIYSHWCGLKDPEKFKKHIYCMLDTPDADVLDLFVAQA